jgi:hypothetical protein
LKNNINGIIDYTLIMSYHLVDITKEDTQYSEVVIGKKINLDNMSKYYIYCKSNEMDDPKEIYIKVPKLRLIYNLANQKYSQVKIPIYPNWKNTDKFIDFIKKMEDEILSNISKKKEISSLVSKKNGLMFIKTRINDDLKITSNLNDKVTLNDFKLNGMIEMIIKINYVWVCEDKIGLSSQLYQIKYHAPPEQLDVDFIDEVKPKINIPIGPPIVGPPIIPPPNNVPEQIGIRMVPSIKDLQCALKKLKKVTE